MRLERTMIVRLKGLGNATYYNSIWDSLNIMLISTLSILRNSSGKMPVSYYLTQPLTNLFGGKIFLSLNLCLHQCSN